MLPASDNELPSHVFLGEAQRQDEEAHEYLASFDPDKPLYQVGWAMGEIQEIFQHKLRSMRNICYVVCSERWYTDGQCLDPALDV